MKVELLFLIVTSYLNVTGSVTNAQTTLPEGNVQLVEFSNSTARFQVPEGKSWYIVNSFSVEGITPVYICLKSINGKDLKNKLNNYSLKLFDSEKQRSNMLPLVLPPNTEFELIILKDGFMSFDLANSTGYLNFIEVESSPHSHDKEPGNI
jgi:hypothetical protein